MTLTKEDREKIIKNASKENKAGSPESQISIFTSRIEYITNHLKNNKKDHSARRGLIQLVSKRKRLLNYLRLRDLELYKKIMQDLNIRESKG